MLFQQRHTSSDPIADAVSSVLEAAHDGFTRSDREMMAWTEGVLTAAAIGPERTRPDEWARAVFGNEPQYQDPVEAQASVAMLALMHNRILADLRTQGAGYEPLFLGHALEGERVALGSEFAAGFLAGMQLRREAWDSWMASKQGKLSVGTILTLLTDADGMSILLRGDADQIATDQEQVLEWLGLATHEIYEYWRAHAAHRQPTTISPFRAPGRNEPCPCGSGKKYKKCCLGQDERDSW